MAVVVGPLEVFIESLKFEVLYSPTVVFVPSLNR
ncbi:hypothetical protein AGR7A_Cc120192 [Agrobacterium deltaense NCPPB 1641]|uniref:Uncharacterized protein n=1 Tax=Agrobacterium deltaense NCPPB 1641 TaxID=1183425 RepID=A0A1S7TJ93_9HYPH|nr:hypothetical protein AGR7A_Cc120192 [Agrobacterium deltaense NCPPB 1641]